MRQSGFDFPIGTYRFLFRGRGVLPAGFGLAQWRGQIGLALYRTACIVEAPDCLQADCEFHTGCAYTRVFRGIGVEAAGAGSAQGNTPPQPFALRDIPATDGCEDTCGFEISLFGRANLALRSLLIAGAAMIEHGIPARNPTLVGELARFGCLDHAAGQWRWSEDLTRLSIPPPAMPQAGKQQPAAARILLLTPVQLTLAASGQAPQPRAFVHAFVTSLIRKVQVALTVYHPLAGSGGEVIEAWKRARDEIYPVTFAVRRPRPGKHKSISLGGYLGRFELAGPGLQALMPLLILGQYIHAGKKATYGNGAFSLQPVHA